MTPQVNRIGTPQDAFEEQVLAWLEKNLPDGFIAFSNLELANRDSHPYEYDVIVLGRRMGWALELKYFRGPILGNDSFWELSNGRVEKNPLPLINQKARVLKQQLVSSAPVLDQSYYITGLVVLPDENARLDLKDDDQRRRVVRLSDLITHMKNDQKPHMQENFNPQALDIAAKVLQRRFGPLHNQARIGDYILEDTAVSCSRFSLTYPAHHALGAYSQTMSRVLLKVYRLDPRQPEAVRAGWLRLFMREADALRLLPPHPQIARCYQPFLVDDDKVALPLEWIDGLPLRDRLSELICQPLNVRLDIFRQVCTVLAHIHAHQIYHRDVRPENLILAGQKVWLVNFQLAKIDMESTLTLATDFLEEPDWRYRAPELRTNPHQVGPETDLFSAGAVLFELATGRCPFSPHAPLTVDARLQVPSRRAKQPMPVVDDLFLKLCAPDPARRLRSAAQALELLDRA